MKTKKNAKNTKNTVSLEKYVVLDVDGDRYSEWFDTELEAKDKAYSLMEDCIQDTAGNRVFYVAKVIGGARDPRPNPSDVKPQRF